MVLLGIYVLIFIDVQWQGADFDDGVPLWDLSRAKSPIWGARKLSYDEELALYSEVCMLTL